MSAANVLDQITGLRALVVGDLMLDEYIAGRATRISPEAPVMVVRREEAFFRPGGAANVALNLRAIGAEVSLLGVIGNDAQGERLQRSLLESQVDAQLVTDTSRVTTSKTRVLADHGHQVLRIDHEDESPISEGIERKLIERFDAILPQVEVIVLSDYIKGLLTPSFVRHVIEHAGEVPVVTNPKPRSSSRYRGARLLSLNRVEASELCGVDSLRDSEAEQLGKTLLEKLSVPYVLLTLGESGMVALSADASHVIPAPRVEVYDTAGAGDTVIAAVAAGLARLGFQRPIFELAAELGARVVRHVGVATPTEQDLLEILAAGAAEAAGSRIGPVIP